MFTNANLAAERANEYIEKGFTAVKFDPSWFLYSFRSQTAFFGRSY